MAEKTLMAMRDTQTHIKLSQPMHLFAMVLLSSTIMTGEYYIPADDKFLAS